jgi:hypothetical protein
LSWVTRPLRWWRHASLQNSQRRSSCEAGTACAGASRDHAILRHRMQTRSTELTAALFVGAEFAQKASIIEVLALDAAGNRAYCRANAIDIPV